MSLHYTDVGRTNSAIGEEEREEELTPISETEMRFITDVASTDKPAPAVEAEVIPARRKRTYTRITQHD